MTPATPVTFPGTKRSWNWGLSVNTRHQGNGIKVPVLGLFYYLRLYDFSEGRGARDSLFFKFIYLFKIEKLKNAQIFP